MELERGKFYNWKHQPERLVYLGKADLWNCFALVGTEKIWCEVHDCDLHMMEETVSQ
jgi:hypothetical protein